jgi:hypothetical protein
LLIALAQNTSMFTIFFPGNQPEHSIQNATRWPLFTSVKYTKRKNVARFPTECSNCQLTFKKPRRLWRGHP